MFRRSSVRRVGYHSHDVQQDQMLGYSPFGWNYLLPQNMVFPWRVNRNMTMAHRNTRAPRAKYTGVWVDVEPMPVVMQEALKPWLSKLALGRTLPPTDPAEAIADFEKISPLLLKNNNNNNNQNSLESQTVRCWLAKVIQLCAMKKQNDLGVELWKKFLSSSSSSSSSSVPVEINLASALLYCTAGSSADAAFFHELFNRCASREDSVGWNATQSFNVNLWNSLLSNRGLKGDEAGVLMIFRELASLQYDVNTLSGDCIIVALNCIKSDELYTEVKEKVLPLFAAERVKVLGYTYTKLRSKAEMAAASGGEEEKSDDNSNNNETAHSVYFNKTLTHAELPENDKMYYHVSWHSRVRQPMEFMPRRLYFDYKPSMAAAKSGTEARKNAKDIVKDRIKTWKEEGLLPEDYDENQELKFHDSASAYKNSMRSEKWKKTPGFLNTPERSGSLLTSGLAGKGPGGK